MGARSIQNRLSHSYRDKSKGTIGVIGLMAIGAVACIVFSNSVGKKQVFNPNSRDFGNAQVLLDAANQTSQGDSIILGVKEL